MRYLQSSWNWVVKVAAIVGVQVVACTLAATALSVFSVVMGWDLIKQFLVLDNAIVPHLDDIATLTAISLAQVMVEIVLMADVVVGGIAAIVWGVTWGRLKYWWFLHKGGVADYYHLYKRGDIGLYEYFAERERKTMSKQNP